MFETVALSGQMLDARYWILDVRCPMLDAGCPIKPLGHDKARHSRMFLAGIQLYSEYSLNKQFGERSGFPTKPFGNDGSDYTVTIKKSVMHQERKAARNRKGESL
jgi:hypothetical protein